jgi:thiol-disulfide isomerase/thioredoxin
MISLAVDKMPELNDQDQFEAMWFLKPEESILEGMRKTDRAFLIYFTAAWCGPCKRLDLSELEKAAKEKNLTLWKCDYAKNEYTPGYCGVRAFPTFQLFHPKKAGAVMQSNETEKVATWIRSL